MNQIGALNFLWLKLRRVPRWAWISGGLVVVLVPALLLWMLIALVGNAWQSGTALLQQERDSLQALLPAAVGEVQQALPEAAASVRQLTGAAQSEVDAAISEAQQALPAASAKLREFTTAAQSEADRALSGWLAPARSESGDNKSAEPGQSLQAKDLHLPAEMPATGTLADQPDAPRDTR